MNTHGKIRTPFSEQQVAALNRWQQDDRFHAFTCGNDRHDEAHKKYQAEHGGDYGQLVATKDGWVCPVPGCGYTQQWAHEFMVGPKCKRCDGRGYGLLNFSDNHFSICPSCNGTGQAV